MQTNLAEQKTLLDPEDAEEQAFVEHLRANGVRVGTQQWVRRRPIGKQRPMWLAFVVRILRKLGYDDG